MGNANNDQDVGPSEPSSSRLVVNMYQCSQAGLMANTEKLPQKKDARYNLITKGAPPQLGKCKRRLDC